MTVKIYDKLSKRELVYLNIDKIDEDRYENGFFTLYKNNHYYGQWRCDYGGKTNCNPFITVNKFRYCDIPMVGKTIFVTNEAAEARLKELKGEKE